MGGSRPGTLRRFRPALLPATGWRRSCNLCAALSFLQRQYVLRLGDLALFLDPRGYQVSFRAKFAPVSLGGIARDRHVIAAVELVIHQQLRPPALDPELVCNLDIRPPQVVRRDVDNRNFQLLVLRLLYERVPYSAQGGAGIVDMAMTSAAREHEAWTVWCVFIGH